MPITDVEVTELEEFTPTRVDGVGKGANGFPMLMIKQIGEDIVEVETTLDDALKAKDDSTSAVDDDRPACTTCHGDGKIKGDNMECPKCKGTGKMPKVGDTTKTLADLALKDSDGAAASGAEVPVLNDCPTCNGSGTIADATADGKTCPDCNGSGNDAKLPLDDKLNAVDADPGSITNGDSKGREAIDKATVSTADQNDLPDSAFAYIEKGGTKDADGKTTPRSLRHFPIMDAAHVRNALARASQSPFGPKAMPAIKAAAEKFDIDVTAKGVDDVEKDGTTTFSAPNPQIAALATQVVGSTPSDGSGDDADASSTPGSPEWEGIDADTATAAAVALMSASELIRTFAQREAIEVAAGEGNDVFDTMAAESALCGVSQALGIMAQMAFHEGMAAQKSIDGVVEKKNKRLSTKSVSAIAAARDHLTELLGDDDPATTDATKAQLLSKEIEDMTADELIQLLDERDAQTATKSTKAKKAKQDVENTESIATGKTANNKAKAKDPKADDTDLEDEAGDASDDSASGTGIPKAAAKAVELTEEEIEANKAAKVAKKAAKVAKKAKKDAATKAALTKSIEESLTKVVEQNEVLKATVETLRGELDGVKQMAAPTSIVKTVPQDAINKATQRDEIQTEIDRLERLAKATPERELSAGYKERVKELRAQAARTA